MRNLSAIELRQHLDSRDADMEAPLLLDVRTPAEYEQGHIEGSWNIPLNQLKDRLPEIPAEQRVVVGFPRCPLST